MVMLLLWLRGMQRLTSAVLTQLVNLEEHERTLGTVDNMQCHVC